MLENLSAIETQGIRVNPSGTEEEAARFHHVERPRQDPPPPNGFRSHQLGFLNGARLPGWSGI